MERCFNLFAAGILALATGGCGHYPAYISSAGSIDRTSPSKGDIILLSLPLDDWPKLQKFSSAWQFRIEPQSPSEISDEQLRSFSRLKMPLLVQFSLGNCPTVTDAGIVALTNIPSIEYLNLEDVAITDRGLRTIATGFPRLKEVGVKKCALMTTNGFMTLTNSRTITSTGLSVGEPFSPKDIENIMVTLSNVTWWIIDDPGNQLDQAWLRRLGGTRNITIEVGDKNKAVTAITTGRVN